MGITHLETHRGKTKAFRIQATAPTDPTPETGDVYIDNTDNSEAIAIYAVNVWRAISLQI
jgi:hypothetical protein